MTSCQQDCLKTPREKILLSNPPVDLASYQYL